VFPSREVPRIAVVPDPETTAEALERHWPASVAHLPGLRGRLLAAYAEPHRGYHDRRHLAEVLGHVAELAGPAGLPEDQLDAVRLAAWFHDAVYEGTRDDEERSAQLATETLAGAGVPPRLVAEVARLVRLTADHLPGGADVPGQVLSDADLAILAAPGQRYAEYVADVRREYADLDDDTFRAGRERVLRALLDKPALFHTEAARSRWEAAARANVQRELGRGPA
jgi:predicted metal-dependent HD superfamily phosphohydrolase